MKKTTESKFLQEQLIDRMQEKETEELIAIWQENDRDAWTDEAFQAIEAILIERLGKLPDRQIPNTDNVKNDGPILKYPTDRKLYWIADLSNRLSWIFLAIAIIYALLKLLQCFFVQTSPIGFWNGTIFILGQIDSVIYAGFVFLVLQAVTEVIYLLMDIREIVQPEITEKSASPDIMSN